MTTPPRPVPNSTLPFWRAGDLHEIDSHRTADFPTEADVLIIGAGYAGVSLAYHILQKDARRRLRVVVLEAREVCSGATGRNGGHLKPDAFIRAANVLALHGKAAAEQVAAFETRHLSAIEEVVRNENIDCDLVLTRSMEVCLEEKGAAELKRKLDAVRDAGVDVRDVVYSEGKGAEEVSGFKGAKASFSNTAGHIWPYKFVTQLLAKAVAQGVNLQTHTPVEAIAGQSDDEGRWNVQTARGNVLAKNVIYASNGYTASILPEVKDKLVPVRGICSRIVCPSSRTPPLLKDTYIIRFNDWEYDYLIPRTDGSIVVGGARRDYYHQLDSWFDVHDDSQLMDSAKHYFDGYMQRHFHGWEDSGAETESVWTGIMGYTSDGFPFVGEVPGRRGQFVCAGFNGHGMPQVFLAAKAVAEMMVGGKEVESVDLPVVYRLTRERVESEERHVSLKAYERFRRSAETKM